MEKPLEIQLKPDNSHIWGRIPFVIGLVLGGLALLMEAKLLIKIILGLCSVLSFLIAKVLSTKEMWIRLDEEQLVVERKILKSTKKKVYNISKIKSLTYQLKVKSETYTTTEHTRVLGVDMTPESKKKYYYHPEILTFYYENRKVTIGKYKEAFGVEEICQRINKVL